MKINKNKFELRVFSIIGQSLLTISGMIVGYVVDAHVGAAIGAGIGFFAARLAEQNIYRII